MMATPLASNRHWPPVPVRVLFIGVLFLHGNFIHALDDVLALLADVVRKIIGPPIGNLAKVGGTSARSI